MEQKERNCQGEGSLLEGLKRDLFESTKKKFGGGKVGDSSWGRSPKRKPYQKGEKKKKRRILKEGTSRQSEKEGLLAEKEVVMWDISKKKRGDGRKRNLRGTVNNSQKREKHPGLYLV